MNKFNIILVAGISALALGSAAAQAQDFNGGFVGAFGGGALGEVQFPETGSPVPFSIDPEGYMLGVDAGFNFSLGNGLVLGVIGDIGRADISDDLGYIGSSISSTIDWVGSVRARAGFDAGNFMPYLTAGLAVAHNTLEFSSTPIEPGPDPVGPTTYSDDQTHVGWTLGAGVEFAATEQLSIDVAYRYNNYGDASYTVPFGGTSPDPEADTTADFGLTSHQLTVGLHYGF
jgi:outer membrane immunogenic protein